MILEGFDAFLWEAANSGRTFSSLGATFSASESEQHLTSEVLLVHEDDALERYVEAASRSQRLIDVVDQDRLRLLRCRDDDGDYVLALWPSTVQRVRYLTGTANPTGSRWRRALSWVRQASPRLSAFYLNQQDLTAVPNELSEYGAVTVGQISTLNLDDGSSRRASWAVSRSKRPPFAEALAEVGRGAAITKMTLHVGGLLELHLRRQAGATLYSGSATLFERFVLTRLAEAGGSRLNVLRDRQRKSSSVSSDVVVVRAPEPVFSNADFTRALPEKVNALSHSGIAVLHSNPYLHFTVTDYVDGSNFDAFVTSECQVEIYPGYYASPGSIARLTDHVASLVGATEIGTEDSSRPPTLDDLLTNG